MLIRMKIYKHQITLIATFLQSAESTVGCQPVTQPSTESTQFDADKYFHEHIANVHKFLKMENVQKIYQITK